MVKQKEKSLAVAALLALFALSACNNQNPAETATESTGAAQPGKDRAVEATQAAMPENPATPPKNTNTDESAAARFTRQSQAYGLRMFQQLEKDSKDRNLVFSPLSIEFMMGIVRTGVASPVADDIARAWGLDDLPVVEMNRNLAQIMKHQHGGLSESGGAEQENLTQERDRTVKKLEFFESRSDSSPDVTAHIQRLREWLDDLDRRIEASRQTASQNRLKIANGLFVDRRYQIEPDFAQKLSNAYQADAQELDFRASKKAAATINQWVDKNTDGRIRRIIDSLDSDTNIALLNAIAFVGQWPEGFFDKKNTKNSPFKGLRESRPVPTMQQNGLEQYYEDATVQAIFLPYRGRKYAMLVILPKDETAQGLANAIGQLDGATFSRILGGARAPKKRYQGTLYLPRFDIENTFGDLLPRSQDVLGVALDGARFPILMDKQTGRLFEQNRLSKMIHKANITVDEEGTRAAAVTALFGATASPQQPKYVPFEMRVDHPFIYAIVDEAGNIAFLGSVKNL